MINQINLAIAQYLYIDYELTQQDKGKALVIPNILTLQTYRNRIKIMSKGIYIRTYSNSDPFCPMLKIGRRKTWIKLTLT